eukprot:TRINITY_DN12291_c0_g1_i3.p1 TRINITY_DN12291_c0_g1~~TRINITY_DN12291_c0_g1_i3.p1  ORF type:complete len:528 (+),score=111.05 TRINITY_DN12291_c0_g1_i3:36-1586(+)
MAPPELSRSCTGASQNSHYSFEDDDALASDGSDEVFDAARGGDREQRRQHVFASIEDLKKREQSLVAEAVECTGLAQDEAALLLRHAAWDVAAFNEAFFEDAEALRRRAGVSDDAESGSYMDVCSTPRSQLCAICFCDPGVRMLPCERRPLRTDGKVAGHPSYCRDCWKHYVEHAVREGKSCLDLRCPTPGCGEALRPAQVEALLTGRDLERYKRFWCESLVDDSHGRVRWCPGQECGRAAAEPPSDAAGGEVECPCGLLWCFGCGTDAHLPVACDTVSKWQSKNRDEGEDATWIRVNTKLCPKCANPIEKNGGCMHMTCRKPGGCGYEFCWICMAPWSSHSACNSEGAEVEKKKEVNKAKQKSELMRYAHYYERYVAHEKAEQFAATDQRKQMESMAQNFSDCFSIAYNDLKFLVQAVDQIRQGRRFLKWTYAHGYFAKYDTNRQKLFEFHQAQLEGTLERLSDITENTQWNSVFSEEVSLKRFYDLRSQVVSLTQVVSEFFGNLKTAIVQETLV